MLDADLSSESWIELCQLDAVADPSDKIEECRFFLKLAEQEKELQNFRWLISAFMGAAYSYFEISALRSFDVAHDNETGKWVRAVNSEALHVLSQYLEISPSGKFVKTIARHPVLVNLYKHRTANTHHYPLSIIAAGENLPEGYYFGYIRGRGEPILSFCKESMLLISEIDQQLKKCF